MELLFLWIENYRGFYKQGFNFSSEFIFTITSDQAASDQTNYHIDIHLNKSYTRIFNKPILNVTGLIGKNGAGKSSLIHCIKQLSGSLHSLTSPLIFSVQRQLENSDENQIETYYYEGGGITEMTHLHVTLSVDNEVRKKANVHLPKPYVINRYLDKNKKIKGLDFDFVEEVQCCFYSNGFSTHPEKIYENITNISTKYAVEDFLSDYIIRVEDYSKRPKRTDEVNYPRDRNKRDHLYGYDNQQVRELMKFVVYVHKEEQQAVQSISLPKIPDSIVLEFNFNDLEIILNDRQAHPGINVNQIIGLNRSLIGLLTVEPNKKVKFKNVLLVNVYYYLMRLASANRQSAVLNRLSSLVQSSQYELEGIFERIDRLINELLIELSAFDAQEQASIAQQIPATNYVNGQALFNSYFDEVLNNVKFENLPFLHAEDLRNYKIKIDDYALELLNIIYQIDERSADAFSEVNDSTFINYRWAGGLSTGEEAFLTQFARFNKLRHHSNARTIWLLIDEGDLYFHPQWQKEYFNTILRFLDFLLPNTKVQLFLTTHSPFIVSDLPNQNLIFLTKDPVSNNCVVLDKTLPMNSFGGNIHDLYKESFFLDGGLIGKFAQDFIDSLIQEIKGLKTISSTYYETNLKNKISIIGEPFIKAKLKELVASKLEVDAIEQLIQQQNLEIERLRKIQQNRHNDTN